MRCLGLVCAELGVEQGYPSKYNGSLYREKASVTCGKFPLLCKKCHHPKNARMIAALPGLLDDGLQRRRGDWWHSWSSPHCPVQEGQPAMPQDGWVKNEHQPRLQPAVPGRQLWIKMCSYIK